MTIQLRLSLPSRSRIGRDRDGRGGQRSTPSSHCPPRSRSGTGPFSSEPPAQILQKPSQQTSNHKPPLSFLASTRNHVGQKKAALKFTPDCWKTRHTTLQHAAAADTCMFALGFIFMVNESQELSVIFVPLVLSEPTPMVEEERAELRPRLCVIQRGSNGYGFNLHSERARPGQYIRAVDDDSPAERAGLQPKDRIVEVNSVSVEGKTHSEVVGAIKAGGDVTRLLVVDPDTEAFFKRCRVTPTSEHLTGPLPEPVINGETEEKVNGKVPKARERNSKLSVSPSPSNASSNASLTTPSAHTPPEGLVTNAIPALNLTLQQVKELTHQKRSNKRAPPMDWTKKNELFSNL